MGFLEEIMFEEELKGIDRELNIIESDLTKLKDLVGDSYLKEDVMDLPSDDIGRLFYEAIRRLEVGKNAFGLVNKLKDPEQRKQHRSRLLGHMNKLRAIVNRLVTMISKGETKGKEDYSDVIGRYRGQKPSTSKPEMSKAGIKQSDLMAAYRNRK